MKLKTTFFATLASLTLLCSTLPAVADSGGAGSVGGNWGGGGQYTDVVHAFYDDFESVDGVSQSDQGSGQASIDWFRQKLGIGAGDPQYAAMQSACSDALNEANSRARAKGVANPVSRVVGLVWSPTNDGGAMSRRSPRYFQEQMDAWKNGGYNGFYGRSRETATDGSNPTALTYSLGTQEIAKAPAMLSTVCIALNNQTEPPLDFELKVTTSATVGNAKAGNAEPVVDKITTSANTTGTGNVAGKVSLVWDGYPATGKVTSAVKDVSLPLNGTVTSPQFTPADFGWPTWPAGRFWFDIQVPRQGDMAQAVDTDDRIGAETFEVTPPAPEKFLATGDGSAQVGGATELVWKHGQSEDFVVTANMPFNAQVSGYGGGNASMTLTDTVATDKVFLGGTTADDESKITVLDPDGAPVTDATITISAGTGTKQVVATFPTPKVGTYTMIVPTTALPNGEEYVVADGGQACWNAGQTKDGASVCQSTPDVDTDKVVPPNDKVWVLDEEGALATSDPDHTNNVGADNRVFLHGDSVGGVVNGSIPASLGSNLTSYQIADDWSDSARYVDFSDASKAKVFVDGVDQSEMFDITVQGTTTVASAKAEFLATTGALEADKVVKLMIMGQFKPVNEDTDTGGNLVKIHNKGWETWNGDKRPTNEPPVFVWNPDPEKLVIGSATQGGDQNSIDGLHVFPGQWVEYQVNLDVSIPDNMAHTVESFGMIDSYDPMFIPNQTSLEVYDARTLRPVPRSDWEVSWNTGEHEFTVSFTTKWIKANLSALKPGDLVIRFDGRVSEDSEAGQTIVNKAWEIINHQKTYTNQVTVSLPPVKPDKEDLNTDLVDIDGKNVLLKDAILYRLTLDAHPSRGDLAYAVHKLGMVDDYDEEYLNIDPSQIRVIRQSDSADVTDKFNIGVIDGKVYAFAKHVDSTNVNGEAIAGTQPEDLAAYAQAPIDPIKDPIIDKELLGHKYWVLLPATVTKVTDGYVIKNQAQQVFENLFQQTKIVSNPLKDIEPDKDVMIDVGGESIDGGEVAINGLFNYQLSSSTIPADRAYGTSMWQIVDDYDQTHDSFTGVWQVVTNTDIYDGDTLAYEAGSVIASSQSCAQDECLFKVTDNDGVLHVEATGAYFDLVNSRLDLAQGWSAYVQMERLLPGTVHNTLTEIYNEVPRQPHEVTTFTPDHPQIDVEKFDTASGASEGDRDSADLALKTDAKSVELTFRITNTGDTPLTAIALSDETLAGSATTGELVCPFEEDFVLEVGQSVDCTATLTGLVSGEAHQNRATVEARSAYTDTPTNEDVDDWFAAPHGGGAGGNGGGAGGGLPLTGTSVGLVALVSVLLTATGGAFYAVSRKKKGEGSQI